MIFGGSAKNQLFLVYVEKSRFSNDKFMAPLSGIEIKLKFKDQYSYERENY